MEINKPLVGAEGRDVNKDNIHEVHLGLARIHLSDRMHVLSHILGDANRFSAKNPNATVGELREWVTTEMEKFNSTLEYDPTKNDPSREKTKESNRRFTEEMKSFLDGLKYSETATSAITYLKGRMNGLRTASRIIEENYKEAKSQ